MSISSKSLKPARSAYCPLPPPMVVTFEFAIESTDDELPGSESISIYLTNTVQAI
jgi:hypothetical protein